MSVLWSDQFSSGGGGGFTSRFASTGITVASGQSGVFITITPPPGQKVRLTALQLNAGTETDISVNVGLSNLIVNKTLDPSSPNTDDKFSVGLGGSDTSFGTYLWFTGDVDEVITVEKTTGSTVNTVQYAYEYGE